MFKVPPPELQIDFALQLDNIRNLFLQDALKQTIKQIEITDLDSEISQFVPKEGINELASCGLRAELLFPVPMLLRQNPRLLGYYRLLYGLSQKEFYKTETGISRFKSMEAKGILTKANEKNLQPLVEALIAAGVDLLNGIGPSRISQAFFDDLTLLTLGPQLRGGANVRKGTAGIISVFKAIHDIVSDSIVNSEPSKIELTNAAGRKVLIEFAPDPDIIIREEMSGSETYRLLIAVEVKGGTDFSNIHNRVGEAEKSHQKARADGYTECWTVVNVDNIDLKIAHKESPTTNRFYKISDLESKSGSEYVDFRARVVSLTGIKD